MKYFQWEYIDDFGKNFKNLTCSDIIHKNIISYEIKRNDSYELTMNCLYSDYDIHQYQQTKNH